MMRFFLKFIDIWQIVESGWSPPSTATVEWSIVHTGAHLSNDKALHALCQDLYEEKENKI
jgi:hypothetical protein